MKTVDTGTILGVMVNKDVAILELADENKKLKEVIDKQKDKLDELEKKIKEMLTANHV